MKKINELFTQQELERLDAVANGMGVTLDEAIHKLVFAELDKNPMLIGANSPELERRKIPDRRH